MKILIITQWFDPEPAFKGLLFAKELVKNGHEVEVVTGFPNYPEGKIYKGYKLSLYKKEVIDKIKIHRLFLYPNHDKSSFKRFLNYTSFFLSSFIGAILFTRKIDLIYSYHPPITTSLSSALVGFLKRIPVVQDIQDLWPDTLPATGMIDNKFILKLISATCIFMYKLSTKIVVLSPGFKKTLISRGVPKEKIEVIYNWCDENSIINFKNSHDDLPDNGNLNILFAGNLGLAQDLPTIVHAAKVLEKKSIPVNIIFLGDGVSKQDAVDLVKTQQIKNCYFINRVPMNEVGYFLHKADALLVHLSDHNLFRITIPSRTQSNLATGKPIIMAVNGDSADLVDSANAGMVCTPGDSIDLANTIEKMVSLKTEERMQLGENGKNFYFSHLSLDHGVKKFISVFQEVLQ
jgi:glycosyltransferase involved in cell wall biosynthesis